MTTRSLKLSLASPEAIKSWTEHTLPNGKKVGKIFKNEFMEYKEHYPVRGGLYCERIFGPVVSFNCTCGRLAFVKNQHSIHHAYRFYDHKVGSRINPTLVHPEEADEAVDFYSFPQTEQETLFSNSTIVSPFLNAANNKTELNDYRFFNFFHQQYIFIPFKSKIFSSQGFYYNDFINAYALKKENTLLDDNIKALMVEDEENSVLFRFFNPKTSFRYHGENKKKNYLAPLLPISGHLSSITKSKKFLQFFFPSTVSFAIEKKNRIKTSVLFKQFCLNTTSSSSIVRAGILSLKTSNPIIDEKQKTRRSFSVDQRSTENERDVKTNNVKFNKLFFENVTDNKKDFFLPFIFPRNAKINSNEKKEFNKQSIFLWYKVIFCMAVFSNPNTNNLNFLLSRLFPSEFPRIPFFGAKNMRWLLRKKKIYPYLSPRLPSSSFLRNRRNRFEQFFYKAWTPFLISSLKKNSLFISRETLKPFAIYQQASKDFFINNLKKNNWHHVLHELFLFRKPRKISHYFSSTFSKFQYLPPKRKLFFEQGNNKLAKRVFASVFPLDEKNWKKKSGAKTFYFDLYKSSKATHNFFFMFRLSQKAFSQVNHFQLSKRSPKFSFSRIFRFPPIFLRKIKKKTKFSRFGFARKKKKKKKKIKANSLLLRKTKFAGFLPIYGEHKRQFLFKKVSLKRNIWKKKQDKTESPIVSFYNFSERRFKNIIRDNTRFFPTDLNFDNPEESTKNENDTSSSVSNISNTESVSQISDNPEESTKNENNTPSSVSNISNQENVSQISNNPSRVKTKNENDLSSSVYISNQENVSQISDNPEESTKNKKDIFSSDSNISNQESVSQISEKKNEIKTSSEPIKRYKLINQAIEKILSEFKQGQLYEVNKFPENVTYCPNCEVEMTNKNIRRYRLGYIEFFTPVAHYWYTSRSMPWILNLSKTLVQEIAECICCLTAGCTYIERDQTMYFSTDDEEKPEFLYQRETYDIPLGIHVSSTNFILSEKKSHGLTSFFWFYMSCLDPMLIEKRKRSSFVSSYDQPSAPPSLIPSAERRKFVNNGLCKVYSSKLSPVSLSRTLSSNKTQSFFNNVSLNSNKKKNFIFSNWFKTFNSLEEKKTEIAQNLFSTSSNITYLPKLYTKNVTYFNYLDLKLYIKNLPIHDMFYLSNNLFRPNTFLTKQYSNRQNYYKKNLLLDTRFTFFTPFMSSRFNKPSRQNGSLSKVFFCSIFNTKRIKWKKIVQTSFSPILGKMDGEQKLFYPISPSVIEEGASRTERVEKSKNNTRLEINNNDKRKSDSLIYFYNLKLKSLLSLFILKWVYKIEILKANLISNSSWFKIIQYSKNFLLTNLKNKLQELKNSPWLIQKEKQRDFSSLVSLSNPFFYSEESLKITKRENQPTKRLDLQNGDVIEKKKKNILELQEKEKQEKNSNSLKPFAYSQEENINSEQITKKKKIFQMIFIQNLTHFVREKNFLFRFCLENMMSNKYLSLISPFDDKQAVFHLPVGEKEISQVRFSPIKVKKNQLSLPFLSSKLIIGRDQKTEQIKDLNFSLSRYSDNLEKEQDNDNKMNADQRSVPNFAMKFFLPNKVSKHNKRLTNQDNQRTNDYLFYYFYFYQVEQMVNFGTFFLKNLFYRTKFQTYMLPLNYQQKNYLMDFKLINYLASVVDQKQIEIYKTNKRLYQLEIGYIGRKFRRPSDSDNRFFYAREHPGYFRTLSRQIYPWNSSYIFRFSSVRMNFPFHTTFPFRLYPFRTTSGTNEMLWEGKSKFSSEKKINWKKTFFFPQPFSTKSFSGTEKAFVEEREMGISLDGFLIDPKKWSFSVPYEIRNEWKTERFWRKKAINNEKYLWAPMKKNEQENIKTNNDLKNIHSRETKPITEKQPYHSFDMVKRNTITLGKVHLSIFYRFVNFPSTSFLSSPLSFNVLKKKESLNSAPKRRQIRSHFSAIKNQTMHEKKKNSIYQSSKIKTKYDNKQVSIALSIEFLGLFKTLLKRKFFIHRSSFKSLSFSDSFLGSFLEKKIENKKKIKIPSIFPIPAFSRKKATVSAFHIDQMKSKTVENINLIFPDKQIVKNNSNQRDYLKEEKKQMEQKKEDTVANASKINFEKKKDNTVNKTSKNDSEQNTAFASSEETKNNDIDQTNYKNKNYYGCISQLNDWGIDNAAFGYFVKYFRSRLFFGDFLLPYGQKRQFFEIMPRTGGIVLEYLLGALENCFSQKDLFDKVEKKSNQEFKESLIIPKSFQFLFMSQVFSSFQDYKKFFWQADYKKSIRYGSHSSSKPFFAFHLFRKSSISILDIVQSINCPIFTLYHGRAAWISGRKTTYQVNSFIAENKPETIYFALRGEKKLEKKKSDEIENLFKWNKYGQIHKIDKKREQFNISRESKKRKEFRIFTKKHAWVRNMQFCEHERFNAKEKKILKFQKKIFETTERISSIKLEKPFYWYQLNHFFSYTDIRVSKFIYSLIISCKRKTFATSWKTIGNPMQSYLFSVKNLNDSFSKKKKILDFTILKPQNIRKNQGIKAKKPPHLKKNDMEKTKGDKKASIPLFLSHKRLFPERKKILERSEENKRKIGPKKKNAAKTKKKIELNEKLVQKKKKQTIELKNNIKKMCTFFKMQTYWKSKLAFQRIVSNDSFNVANDINIIWEKENCIKETNILRIYYQIFSFNYHFSKPYYVQTKTVLLICLVLIKLFKIVGFSFIQSLPHSAIKLKSVKLSRRKTKNHQFLLHEKKNKKSSTIIHKSQKTSAINKKTSKVSKKESRISKQSSRLSVVLFYNFIMPHIAQFFNFREKNQKSFYPWTWKKYRIKEIIRQTNCSYFDKSNFSPFRISYGTDKYLLNGLLSKAFSYAANGIGKSQTKGKPFKRDSHYKNIKKKNDKRYTQKLEKKTQFSFPLLSFSITERNYGKILPFFNNEANREKKKKRNWFKLGISNENKKKFYFSSDVYDLNSTKIKSSVLLKTFFNSSNNVQNTIFPIDQKSNFIEKTKIYNIFISDFFSIDWKNNTNENMAFLPSLNFPSWAPNQNIFSPWSQNDILITQEDYDRMFDETSAIEKSKFTNWPNLEETHLKKEKILVSNCFEKKSTQRNLFSPSFFTIKKKKHLEAFFPSDILQTPTNFFQALSVPELSSQRVLSVPKVRFVSEENIEDNGEMFSLLGNGENWKSFRSFGKIKKNIWQIMKNNFLVLGSRKKQKNLKHWKNYIIRLWQKTITTSFHGIDREISTSLYGVKHGMQNFSYSFSVSSLSKNCFDLLSKNTNYKTKYLNFLEGENILMQFNEIGNYVKQLKKKNTVFKTVILKMDNLLQPLTISEYYFQKAFFYDHLAPNTLFQFYSDTQKSCCGCFAKNKFDISNDKSSLYQLIIKEKNAQKCNNFIKNKSYQVFRNSLTTFDRDNVCKQEKENYSVFPMIYHKTMGLPLFYGLFLGIKYQFYLVNKKKINHKFSNRKDLFFFKITSKKLEVTEWKTPEKVKANIEKKLNFFSIWSFINIKLSKYSKLSLFSLGTTTFLQKKIFNSELDYPLRSELRFIFSSFSQISPEQPEQSENPLDNLAVPERFSSFDADPSLLQENGKEVAKRNEEKLSKAFAILDKKENSPAWAPIYFLRFFSKRYKQKRKSFQTSSFRFGESIIFPKRKNNQDDNFSSERKLSPKVLEIIERKMKNKIRFMSLTQKATFMRFARIKTFFLPFKKMDKNYLKKYSRYYYCHPLFCLDLSFITLFTILDDEFIELSSDYPLSVFSKITDPDVIIKKNKKSIPPISFIEFYQSRKNFLHKKIFKPFLQQSLTKLLFVPPYFLHFSLIKNFFSYLSKPFYYHKLNKTILLSMLEKSIDKKNHLLDLKNIKNKKKIKLHLQKKAGLCLSKKYNYSKNKRLRSRVSLSKNTFSMLTFKRIFYSPLAFPRSVFLMERMKDGTVLKNGKPLMQQRIQDTFLKTHSKVLSNFNIHFVFRKKINILMRNSRYKKHLHFLQTFRQLRFLEYFQTNCIKPKWMIIRILPVLPPDLRPIIPIPSGHISSDFNTLYEKIVYQNDNIFRILDIHYKGPLIVYNIKHNLSKLPIHSSFLSFYKFSPSINFIRDKSQKPKSKKLIFFVKHINKLVKDFQKEQKLSKEHKNNVNKTIDETVNTSQQNQNEIKNFSRLQKQKGLNLFIKEQQQASMLRKKKSASKYIPPSNIISSKAILEPSRKKNLQKINSKIKFFPVPKKLQFNEIIKQFNKNFFYFLKTYLLSNFYSSLYARFFFAIRKKKSSILFKNQYKNWFLSRVWFNYSKLPNVIKKREIWEDFGSSFNLKKNHASLLRGKKISEEIRLLDTKQIRNLSESIKMPIANLNRKIFATYFLSGKWLFVTFPFNFPLKYLSLQIKTNLFSVNEDFFSPVLLSQKEKSLKESKNIPENNETSQNSTTFWGYSQHRKAIMYTKFFSETRKRGGSFSKWLSNRQTTFVPFFIDKRLIRFPYKEHRVSFFSGFSKLVCFSASYDMYKFFNIKSVKKQSKNNLSLPQLGISYETCFRLFGEKRANSGRFERDGDIKKDIWFSELKNNLSQLKWCSPQKENIISNKILTPYPFIRCQPQKNGFSSYFCLPSHSAQFPVFNNIRGTMQNKVVDEIKAFAPVFLSHKKQRLEEKHDKNFFSEAHEQDDETFFGWFEKHKTISDIKNKFSRFIYYKKSMISSFYLNLPLRFSKFDENTTLRIKQLRIGILNTHPSIQQGQYGLQKIVNILIDNNQKLQSSVFWNEKRLFISLSEQLKGKQGRFRLNLLGKRVDYSGRSVIIVGPNLKVYECGIPIVMALTLFQSFLTLYLVNEFDLPNVVAVKLIQEKHPIIIEILNKFIAGWPVLLNRAPTLHRMNIQAFKIRLVQGKCILLHPLVCSSFNADFDGDQMGLHIPLTLQAQAESWKLLWSINNSINLASRQPLFLPSQDLVIGNYYLTKEPLFQYSILSHTLQNETMQLDSDQTNSFPHSRRSLEFKQKFVRLISADNKSSNDSSFSSSQFLSSKNFSQVNKYIEEIKLDSRPFSQIKKKNEKKLKPNQTSYHNSYGIIKDAGLNHHHNLSRPQETILFEQIYLKKFPVFNTIEEAYKYYSLNIMNNIHVNSPVWFYSFSLFETAEREKPIEVLIDKQGYNILISKYYEIHLKRNRFKVKRRALNNTSRSFSTNRETRSRQLAENFSFAQTNEESNKTFAISTLVNEEKNKNFINRFSPVPSFNLSNEEIQMKNFRSFFVFSPYARKTTAFYHKTKISSNKSNFLLIPYSYRSCLNLFALLGKKKIKVISTNQNFLFYHNQIQIDVHAFCFNFSHPNIFFYVNSTNFFKNQSYLYFFKPISVKQILRSTFGRIEFYLNTL